MTTLRDATAKLGSKVAAPRTITLPPSVFASEWEKRPKLPVEVGIRTLSDGDEQTAIAEATKYAIQAFPDGGEGFVDSYNDALIRWIVARGICSPLDVNTPSFVLELPDEELVRQVFTRAGTRYVFDAIERLQLETSPIFPEANDDEISDLAAMLSRDEPLDPLVGTDAARARRLLAFVLYELQAAQPLPDP